MRIVLVEQSRVGLKIMSTMLRQRGHEVYEFRDGEEAIKYIEADEFVELVITSFESLTISGLQVCWEARLLAGESRALYVIAMSSTYDGHSLERALDSGADDFIAKPPNDQELHARLRAAERLLAAQRKLIRLANRDPLTDLLNRRAFLEKAAAARDRAIEMKMPLSAIIVDIDHFKRVNDTYGHDVGDDVIRTVAQELNNCSSVVGRLGGEEFGIILEWQTPEEGFEVIDRLRKVIAGLEFDTALEPIRVTVSAGIASGPITESIRTLLKRADLALYSSKQNGRNRVTAFDSIEATIDPGSTDAGTVAA